MARADTGTLGPFLGVAGALTLLGAAASTWIARPEARSVGDVAVTVADATPGVEIAPLSIVAALLGLVCSVALLATRGGARRTVSLLLVVCGIAAVAVAGVGVVRLSGMDGVTTAAPWLAVCGAAVLLAAGLLGFGRPGRRLPRRYDVDVAPTDDEWRMADGDAGPDGPPSYASSPDPPGSDHEAEHR